MPRPADFAILVREELRTARRAQRPIHSLHEGYAVILEELDEFWDEVKNKKREQLSMLKELVQVAAMCERTAVDCIMPVTEGEQS